jgi:hypothetical protein
MDEQDGTLSAFGAGVRAWLIFLQYAGLLKRPVPRPSATSKVNLTQESSDRYGNLSPRVRASMAQEAREVPARTAR